MERIIIVLFVFCSSAIYSQSAKDAITKAMADQQAAWNKGDIDGFMAHYWRNDSLKFIGSKGITYGWQPTLDNYKKSYPDKATMGTLTFTNISIEQLSDNSCYVTGKWFLKREKGDVGGYYTLLWKRISGKWMIVADHTS